jgi:hypothetical protein
VTCPAGLYRVHKLTLRFSYDGIPVKLEVYAPGSILHPGKWNLL